MFLTLRYYIINSEQSGVEQIRLAARQQRARSARRHINVKKLVKNKTICEEVCVMRKRNWLILAVLFFAVFVYLVGGRGGGDTASNSDSTEVSEVSDVSEVNDVSSDVSDVTVYVNGNIYTVDSEFSKASAMVEKGGRLLYVGDSEKAREDYGGTGAKIVDLKGKTVLPGLIENHMHYQMLGQMIGMIDIINKPKEEILEAVRAEADRLDDGKWIYSFGWNQELWDVKEWPAKGELDDVAPNNPVFLDRVDGHSAWLNSMALELCGITKDTPDPEGGVIDKGTDGEPTGIVREVAVTEASSHIPPATDEEKLVMYSDADREVLSYGITTLVDAGISNSDVNILKKAYQDGKLKVRAYEMLSAGEDDKFIKENQAPQKDLYDGRLSVNAVKVYADGSFGSRTAWLKDDYSDDEGNKGTPIYGSDVRIFNGVVRKASGYGFQVGTHAIGDAAVSAVLDAYEAAVDKEGLADRRFRIEHYSMVSPEDVRRTVDLGVIPAIQGYFAPSDMVMAPNRVGPSRVELLYSWRDIIDAGARIVNGSDAPVENVNPYEGLFAAVARQNREGEPSGGWRPDQKITREEALKSYTIWGAYATFSEDSKGSLETGKYADFVVIDRDYMDEEMCPDSEIKNIEALATVVGGELVYGSLE
jgi:predicted amidohydrolase YtcJ